LAVSGVCCGFCCASHVRALLARHGKNSVLATAIGSDRKGKISIVIYIIAIVFAFVHSLFACALYVLVAVIWLVPDRRIENKLTFSPSEGEKVQERSLKMKKCPDCERELDRHMIACQYCGEVEESRKKEKHLVKFSDPKALINYFVEEVINKKNLKACDIFVAKDFIEHVPLPGQRQGREGLKEAVGMLHTAFPDLRWKVEEQMAEGEKVVSRFTWTGTQRGAFLGILPTGKKVKVWGVVIDVVRRGQFAESRIIMDTPGLLEQLGVITGS